MAGCKGCSSGTGCNCSVVGSADGAITMAGSGAPITSPFTPTFHGDAWMTSITVDDATACSALNSPHVIVRLGDGSLKRVPLPCPTSAGSGTIGGNAFAFTFSPTTTDSDPGDGFVRFNNSAYASVTSIFIDLTDSNATVVMGWLDSLAASTATNKGRIRVYSRAQPNRWVDFLLTGVTVVSGYRKLVVTYNASSGVALTTNAADTVVDFAPAADVTGPTGPTGATGGWNSVQPINSVVAAYTLVLADQGKMIEGNNASAFSVTVPPNASVAFPIGAHIDFFQLGAGQITIAAGSGVTIRAYPGLKLIAQYTGATLVKAATDTWYLVGNLTT